MKDVNEQTPEINLILRNLRNFFNNKPDEKIKMPQNQLIIGKDNSISF